MVSVRIARHPVGRNLSLVLLVRIIKLMLTVFVHELGEGISRDSFLYSIIIRDGSPIGATEFKYSTDPSLESAAIGSKKVKKNKKNCT